MHCNARPAMMRIVGRSRIAFAVVLRRGRVEAFCPALGFCSADRCNEGPASRCALLLMSRLRVRVRATSSTVPSPREALKIAQASCGTSALSIDIDILGVHSRGYDELHFSQESMHEPECSMNLRFQSGYLVLGYGVPLWSATAVGVGGKKLSVNQEEVAHKGLEDTSLRSLKGGDASRPERRCERPRVVYLADARMRGISSRIVYGAG
jgi:hypothetical protein